MPARGSEGDRLRDKAAYLSFVQANIARMSNYSCAIKGLCCALSVGQLALFQQARHGCAGFALCALALCATAGLLSVFDSRYLQLERLNRALYKEMDASGCDYRTDMVVPPPSAEDRTRRCDAYVSWSVLGFYSVLAVCLVGTAAIALLG